MKIFSYQDRLLHSQNLAAQRLLEIMIAKQTNLCVAADVCTKQALLELAEQTGNEICLFKTHMDIIEDFDQDLIDQLQSIAKSQQFLIFEDRKFADIGATVQKQYEGGVYHIAEWSDFINAHLTPGPGIIEGLKQVGHPKGHGLILLAQMSSAGALTDVAYQQKAVKWAENSPDFIVGFIAREQLTESPALLHFTPGIHLSANGDALGQQYLTPEQAISQGSDILIVGRGITQAPNAQVAAQHYRESGWVAYEKARL